MDVIARRALGLSLVTLFGFTAPYRASADQPPFISAQLDVAAFDRIENDHLTAVQRAIDKIVAQKGAISVGNTLVPYDEAIRELDSAGMLAGLMQQVHPDESFRDHATEMVTKVSGVQTALTLNREVYGALAKLNVSRADAATRYYVQRTLLEYRLAGVNKDDASRAKLKQLQDQLTTDQSAYDRNISDDVRTVKITDLKELDGLPNDFIDAHKPDSSGVVTLDNNYPDLGPVLTYATSDALRRRMWAAHVDRAYPKNRAVLLDMMQTRQQIANIVGYPTWADYNAADKMVGNGARIAQFISELDRISRPLSDREMAMMLAEKRKTDPGATQVYDYEVSRLNELVRRANFDFDSGSVRPYLPYTRVRQGILDTAASLFHVTFRQETDATAWHPSVETWDVLDGGKMVGRFYLDMHPRPGKYSHAETAPLLDGVRGKQLPEGALVCNFPETTASDPGLMQYDDVVVFFHEFGHLMHHILGGQQQWAGISGMTVEGDFVEAPSQMLEEWMRSPQVLASFARHYTTGEVIPAELVARMNRASAFGRGSWTAKQLTYTAVSYDLYSTSPQNADPDAVVMRDDRRYSGFVPLEGDSHEYAAFGHLAGYSSAYYTYLWDKVIAEDFYGQFDHANLLAGEAPMRYRRIVLEPGGSMSANTLVQNFLGRPQSVDALKAWMGEEFASQ